MSGSHFLSIHSFPLYPWNLLAVLVIFSVFRHSLSVLLSVWFSFSLYPLRPVERFPPIRKPQYFPLVLFKVFPPRFSPAMRLKVQHSAENFFAKIMWEQFFFLNHMSKSAVQSKLDAKVRKPLGNCSSQSFLSGIYQLLVLRPFCFGFKNGFLLSRETNGVDYEGFQLNNFTTKITRHVRPNCERKKA